MKVNLMETAKMFEDASRDCGMLSVMLKKFAQNKCSEEEVVSCIRERVPRAMDNLASAYEKLTGKSGREVEK